MTFKAADSSLFFSKKDPEDPRLGDIVKRYSEENDISDSAVIVGYPDDEGIKLNGGRLGAAGAPSTIRKSLYKMTPGLNSTDQKIFDYGDIEIIGSLNDRHKAAQTAVSSLLKKRGRVVCVGGGHDYSYSDCAAFCELSLESGRRPFIINIDAHLDVRPDDKGANSGTAFYRLLKKYSKDIDFFEIGIQDWCNSRNHVAWAKDHGAKIITLDEILASGKDLSHFLSEKVLTQVSRKSDLALSLDIDGVASQASPGASQVFPVGLTANDLLKFWKIVVGKFRPSLMGVYEVSPPLDLDDRTSKLAAIFIHQFIY